MADFLLSSWLEILNPAPWSARCLCRCVSVGEYVYMCGGYTTAGVRLNDVWRSSDLIEWEELTANAEWPARSAHGFIYFNGLFYVMGGSNGSGPSGYFNDVWSSPDCITWTLVTANAGWSIRHEFALCEHNGKMIISGGYGGYSFRSDVWSSSDASSWTQKATNIDGSRGGPREHIMASYLDSLWIMGGDMTVPAVSTINRIYNSPDDGATWNYIGLGAFGSRREHQYVISYDELGLVVIGGSDGSSALNDVWETVDGSTFTEIVQVVPYTARSDFGFVKHFGKAYIIGGINAVGAVLGDVWRGDIELHSDFVGDPLTIQIGDTVTFTDYSSGDPIAWEWNFGDGSDSNYEQNPTHVYDRSGSYTVTLTVTDDDLETDSEIKVGYITVLPYSLDFVGVPTSGISPLEVGFSEIMV